MEDNSSTQRVTTKNNISYRIVNGTLGTDVVVMPLDSVKKEVDPEVDGQTHVGLSLMLFKEPKIHRGKMVSGFMKVRGVHNSAETAVLKSKKLIEKLGDDKKILIAQVGRWLPITESNFFVEEEHDVDNAKEKHSLRDTIAKEKELEAKKIMKELKENEAKLKDEGDVYDNPESLYFYTMKRNTEKVLSETLEIERERIKKTEDKLAEQRIICKRLEAKFPSYADEWLDCFNKERMSKGIPEFIPGENQFLEYDSVSLENLLTLYPNPKQSSIGKNEDGSMPVQFSVEETPIFEEKSGKQSW